MTFRRLAEAFADLERTSSRLAMVRTLAALLAGTNADDVQPAIYLLQGRLGPSYDAPQFGISEKLTTRVLAQFTGQPVERVETLYRELGDHGLVAEQLLKTRPRGKPGPTRRSRLTVRDVFGALHALATAAGAGSIERKITALVDLLGRADALEAKYLLRIPMGTLRLGVGDATIMDALSEAKTGLPRRSREAAKAGDKSMRPAIERAYNLCSDLGLVARTLYASGETGVKRFKVQVGRPIKMQFAERVKSIEEIVRRLGTCATEPKYDGFRCQVHKNGTRVRIFSRNQEDTTAMFPDIAAGTLRQVGASRAIFEGEALAYDPDSGEFHPFQVTVRRKRTHGIDAMQAALPLRLNVFDLLYLDGDDLTPQPYRDRRGRVAKLLKKGDALAVAPALISGDAADITRFFEAQIGGGLEGIVAKRLDSPYEAGKRSFNWIKFKRAYHGALKDTVDLAIVGYFSPRGQRARIGIGAVLGAVYDKRQDRFRTLAKVASGLSDEQWIALRRRLEKLRVDRRPARVDSRLEPPCWVEPKLVIEVFADEITRSPVHTAGVDEAGFGYALRFPRIVGGVREDRKPEDATTEDEIRRLFALQKRAKV